MKLMNSELSEPLARSIHLLEYSPIYSRLNNQVLPKIISQVYRHLYRPITAKIYCQAALPIFTHIFYELEN